MRTKHVFANKEEEKTWQMHLMHLTLKVIISMYGVQKKENKHSML
jgi:hypothetical protein